MQYPAKSLVLAALLAFPASLAFGEDIPAEKLAECNVVWNSPSENSLGSMPLGNGCVGVNAWVEPDGELVLLLSKTDAWSENCRLLKLGRVRVALEPTPLAAGEPMEQQLRLQEGEMTVRFGEGRRATRLRVWVDAHRPVVHVEADCAEPSQLEASLEVWRSSERELEGDEVHSAYGVHGGPEKIVCYPDTVVEGQSDRVLWYHRNTRSIWADNLRHQGLEALIDQLNDPLMHRTFGGLIEGEGLRNTDSRTLRSVRPRKRFALAVHVQTSQAESAEAWIASLEAQAAAAAEVPLEAARETHRRWWREFWNRGWIFLDGPAETEAVNRGYTLQRWISACGGRGAHPIKFNGSIFTVDMAGFDPDYRRWGGPYWWQNTRLPYWPMLACGDFEMMLPMFRMYRATLPLAEFRTKKWFGHGGAFLPETMYFWGMYTNSNYGWDRGDLAVGELTNRYIRREYTSSPELLAMMLDYYDFTRDKSFLREELLPMSDSLLEFWDKHYERDEQGHLVMYPAQALETLQDAKNPTPDVAGLKWVLTRLLELPEEAAGGRRAFWTRLLKAVPPLPMAGEPGDQWVRGAEEIFGGRGNSENPELYAVFPFRLYGVGKPDLEIGRRTFEKRAVKGNTGWRQDDTQAALLGLTEVASRMVADRAKRKAPGSRFPAFWGPNFDWVPDQDHGGNLMRALQAMVLQADEGQIRLLPAWPRQWNVDFKLHAPNRATVRGVYRDGKLEEVDVSPEIREKDVSVLIEGEAAE